MKEMPDTLEGAVKLAMKHCGAEAAAMELPSVHKAGDSNVVTS